MKLLITYATRTGCTEDLARRIGATLRTAGNDVRVIPIDSAPRVDDFDAVIVGSGVRAGKWHANATDWVVGNANKLAARPLALFTCCLTMKDGQSKAPEVIAYTRPMLDKTGLKPVGIGLFPGWFVPEKFGFIERSILKMMKSPQGDFRDFSAADAWAGEIAARLGMGVAISSQDGIDIGPGVEPGHEIEI